MVKKFNINLKGISGYTEGEYDKKIRGQLKRQGVFNKNYLYSVFNGRRVKQIEETGNYREENFNSIFALTQDELVWESEFSRNCIKELSRQYLASPAIAIYDKNQFKEAYEGNKHEYFFINRDKKLEALVAIAFLKFN